MSIILCVDDHLPTLQTLSLIIQFAGYRSLEASGAIEAEGLFTAHSVDLLIVDHGLPGITGFELAKHLKTIRNVKVLMLTGNAELMSQPSCVDVLVQKPFPPSRLLDMIRKLVPAVA